MPLEKVKKTRLDSYLVQLGLAADIKNANILIMLGYVYQDTVKLTSAGMMIKSNAAIIIKPRKSHDYVSRAALKLAHAIDYFKINVTDLYCLDIGCGAGSFTEVLLQNNAQHVYAVDVGYGEFDWKLRHQPKVTLYERTNARFLTNTQIVEPLDLIVCDASFISLTVVLESALALLKSNGKLVALIKPQFEAARHQVGEKGIIRDITVHEQVCEKITIWLESMNFIVYGITTSPITGMKGNKEFLIFAGRDD